MIGIFSFFFSLVCLILYGYYEEKFCLSHSWEVKIKNRNTETGDYCSWITFFFFFQGKQESKQNLYLAPTIASAHPLTSWGKSTKKPLTMDWKKEWNKYLLIIISIEEISLIQRFELIWFALPWRYVSGCARQTTEYRTYWSDVRNEAWPDFYPLQGEHRLRRWSCPVIKIMVKISHTWIKKLRT